MDLARSGRRVVCTCDVGQRCVGDKRALGRKYWSVTSGETRIRRGEGRSWGNNEGRRTVGGVHTRRGQEEGEWCDGSEGCLGDVTWPKLLGISRFIVRFVFAFDDDRVLRKLKTWFRNAGYSQFGECAMLVTPDVVIRTSPTRPTRPTPVWPLDWPRFPVPSVNLNTTHTFRLSPHRPFPGPRLASLGLEVGYLNLGLSYL